jgi:hypothetical protein
MILVFEPIYSGTSHAPGNAHLLATIATAVSPVEVRMHAEPGHLAELQRAADLASVGTLTFREIALAPRLRGQVNVVSAGRFRHELRMLMRALGDTPNGEPCLIVLASATGTAITAARLALRLAGRRGGVQVGLHGDLNAIEGWRTRNPLLRPFDLRGQLSRPARGVRFLVFEPAIARELGRLLPAADGRTDVLPLAVNSSEMRLWHPPPPPPPLRIGLVGQTTRAKGIGPFLETARRFRQSHGERVEFHIVGRRMPDTDPATLADIAHAVPDTHLSRPEFLQRLAALHYVFLPLEPIYYRLSASGALLDALTWLKPVIATDLPIVADLFAAGGDIGHLCPSVEAMQDALRQILDAPDPARYGRQVEALRQLRETRTPEALAPVYRRMLEAGFSTLGLPPSGAAQGAGGAGYVRGAPARSV